MIYVMQQIQINTCTGSKIKGVSLPAQRVNKRVMPFSLVQE